MKRNPGSNVARIVAVALALAAPVGWVSAIGAAPKCYSSRYQVNSSTGEVHDAATGLTWQQSVDPMSYTWDAAKMHCSGTWRLPSLTELQTIVDDTKKTPPLVDNVFTGTPSTVFWTSSLIAGSSISAWLVDFGNGALYSGGVTGTSRVRCVR